MRNQLYTLFLCFLLTVSKANAEQLMSHNGCTWFDSGLYRYRMLWNLTDSQIFITLEANTTGWVGMGISTDGSMTSNYEGSDIFIAFVKEGSGYVHDYWSTDHSKPTKDESQDVELVSYAVNQGFTTVQFRRPLNTNDQQDRPINVASPSHVIWALSPVSPLDSTGDFLQKHALMGSKIIDWAKSVTCEEPGHDIPPTTNQWGNDVYQISWNVDSKSGSITEDDDIIFTVKARTTGWVGLGFGTGASMTNADMVVGWVESTNGVLVDCWSGPERIQPTQDVLKGGTNDIYLMHSKEYDGWTEFTFKRKLTTDDVMDVDIVNQPIYMIWALGDEDGILDGASLKFSKHSQKGVVQINFINGKIQEVPHQHQHRSFLILLHGIIMTVSWGMFITTGSFIARFLKPILVHNWFKHHIWINVIGILGTTIGFGIAVYELHKTESKHFSIPHHIIGLIVALLAVLQGIIGYLSHAKYDANRSQTPIWPDKLHWWVGRLVLALALINIFLGFNALDVSNVVWVLYFIWCGHLIVTNLAVLYYQRKKGIVGNLYQKLDGEGVEGGALHLRNTYVTRVLALALIISVTLLAVAIGFMGNTKPNTVEKQPFKVCPDCREVTFVVDNYNIPVGFHDPKYVNPDTTYVCKGFDLPTDSSYHIVEFEPIINNSDILHHMVIYSLPYSAVDDGYFDCINMPEAATPIFIWAVGGQPLQMPPNVGFKAGKGTEVKHVAIQMHYDNPTLNSNSYDSSGVKIKMTPVLREYNGGILVIGSVSGLRLPPGHRDYEVSGECPYDTLSQLPFPLHVFGSMIHAHRLGRIIWTEQWREGSRIGNINNQHMYNFNDQRIQLVDRVIQPGDSLVTHCVYDTTSKTEITYGGEGTSNEMCINILWYYPQVDASFCLKKPVVINATIPHYRPDKV